jgi:hypothetical protein
MKFCRRIRWRKHENLLTNLIKQDYLYLILCPELVIRVTNGRIFFSFCFLFGIAFAIKVLLI